MVTIMNLIIRHGWILRQRDRVENLVLAFSEDNVIAMVLRAAYEEWNNAREVGKPHPAGKPFRSIAWQHCWTLAMRAWLAGGSKMELAEQNYLKKRIETLQVGLEAVQRFYPAQLALKEKKEGKRGNLYVTCV